MVSPCLPVERFCESGGNFCCVSFSHLSPNDYRLFASVAVAHLITLEKKHIVLVLDIRLKINAISGLHDGVTCGRRADDVICLLCLCVEQNVT